MYRFLIFISPHKKTKCDCIDYHGLLLDRMCGRDDRFNKLMFYFPANVKLRLEQIKNKNKKSKTHLMWNESPRCPLTTWSYSSLLW